MKKLIYSVFALAGILSVSCTKEVEAPVTPDQETAKTFIPYTFKGTIGEDTRTAYADNKTFSWKAGDKIDLYTYNETDGYYQISTFEAQEDGVTTTFAGELEDGYAPGPLAVYPDHTGFVNGQPAVYVPSFVIMDGDDETYYTASSDNPLENLVLVGTVNEEGTAYAFKTAMGAVKLTFTDLPEGSCYLRVSAPEKISGYFYIDENGILTNESAVPGSYTDNQGDTRNFSNYNLWYEFTPASDGSVTLYIPLPVGKLSAGTTFYIEDEDENPLYRRSAAKDIIIERNKVTEVTSLATYYTWESMGTGKFYDRFAWATGKFTTGAYVDVEIEKDLENPYHYRLVAPYDAAFDKFNYKPNRLATPADPYFEFFVEKSGYVDYPQTCTGVYYRSDNIKESTYLISPLTAYGQGKDRGYNVVARYLEDGVTPANVLIAPSYYWPKSGYWSGDNYYYSSDEIQILFPGVSEAVDVSCSASFAEIADDSVEQPIALIDVSFGEHIASAKVIIAQDKAAAEAAAAAGEFGGEATASSVVEVNMPADAESGNYYIYLLPTPAEGLSPALSFLVESEDPFQYVRTDAPDITVEEVVGTYTATDTYVYFNKPYWDAIEAGEEDPEEDEEDATWYGPYTVSFTLEESDDEGLGDVMMTAFNENAVGYCPIETPIYATLDPKSGAITFAPMQPIYSFNLDSTGELIEVQLANGSGFATENLVFELSLDKTTYTSKQFFGYVFYFTEQDGFNYPDIWFSPTNVPLKLVKETEPATDEPAAAPAVKRTSILKHLRAEKPGKAVSFDAKPLVLVR
jgi:hypothetical protein